VQHALRPTPESAGQLYGVHFWVSVPQEHRHRFAQPLREMLHAAGLADNASRSSHRGAW